MSRFAAIALLGILLCGGRAFAQTSESDLRAAFAGAQIVDLRTSQVSSVVTLREKVGIPAPSTPVLLKIFDRKALPEVLRPVFADPHRMAVTINGEYIAIIKTELRDEYADTLRHELVHAYISLASPKPLPLWFQEGSAVHYSMGKDRKFYGQPAQDQAGVMVGKTIELPEDYKQKLQTFNYVLQTSGEQKFNAWYKRAVETGDVDPGPLLGLDPKKEAAAERPKHSIPRWVFGALAGAVIAGVMILAYMSSKRSDYY